MMKIVVTELPARTLVGKSADFYGAQSPKFNGPELLGPIWGSMNSMRDKLGLPERTTMIGATRPAAAAKADDGLLNQFVGYVVEDLPADLFGLEVLSIPSGRFACVDHVGSIETLVDAVRVFYSDLDSLEGYTQRPGLHLEIYDERFDMSSPDSIMTIAAPVARR